MLRDVSTLGREASIEATYTAMVSLSDTVNLLEGAALKMVRHICRPRYKFAIHLAPWVNS